MSKFPSRHNWIPVMSVARSLETRLRPLQIFGTLPLSMEPPVFSKLSIRRLIVSALLSFLMVYFLLVKSPYQGAYLKPLTATLYNVTSCMYAVVIPTATLIMIKKRFIFGNAVHELLAMRAELGLGETRYPILVWIYILTYVLLSVGSKFNIILAIRFSPDLYSWMNIIDDVCWDCFFACMTVTCSQFIFLIHLVGECFKQLAFKIPKKGQTIQSNVDSKRFIKDYDVLTDLAHEIFDCYDIVVGETLLSNFSCMMAHGSACLISSITNPFKRNEFSIWIPYHLLTLAVLMAACVSISSKAEECNKALLRYIIHDKSEVYQDNPLVMIHLSSRKTLTFTACKCVNVDYRLGLSMVAAFLTYIVVLFQIESPSAVGSAHAEPNSTKVC